MGPGYLCCAMPVTVAAVPAASMPARLTAGFGDRLDVSMSRLFQFWGLGCVYTHMHIYIYAYIHVYMYVYILSPCKYIYT